MSGFFKPWRRKIGVATLAMACLFMVGWVRSQFQCDDLEIPIGAAIYGVESKAGGIDFSRTTSAFANRLRETPIFLTGPITPDDMISWSPYSHIKWRWDLAG